MKGKSVILTLVLVAACSETSSPPGTPLSIRENRGHHHNPPPPPPAPVPPPPPPPAPPPAPPPPPPPGSPEPQAGDVILWQDNFDARTDFSGYARRGTESLIAGRGNTGKAARFSYTTGSSDNLIEKGFTETGDIYFRYWYRVTPSGAVPYSGRSGAGMKWFMAWRPVAPGTGRYTCGTSLLSDNGISPNSGYDFSCADESSVREPDPFNQNITKSPKFGTTNDGNWHEYTLHIVVGTGGYEQIWVDGVRVLDNSGLGFDHFAQGITLIQFPGLVVDGIPSTAWNFAIDVDDFVIWHK